MLKNKYKIGSSASKNPRIRIKSASQNPRIRIIMATGIFPPDIGGPALYSQKLAGEFSKAGIEVSVLTYGKKFSKSDKYRPSSASQNPRICINGVTRLWPYGLRQIIYFFKLIRYVKKSDAILAFDSLGAGLPAVLAGKLSGKKVIIRMGGDFLWEKYIEFGKEKVTIVEFYQKNLQKSFPFSFRLIKFTLQNADKIVFTTEFQRNLFIPVYGLNLGRCVVAGNVFNKESDKLSAYGGGLKIILWAGRFIKLKNLEFLLKVFKRLLANDKNLVLKLIGDGPEREALKLQITNYKLQNNIVLAESLSEDSLAEEIKKSYFCVLPSLSEISPNFALKCLSLNKPIIITQETGIRKEFPGLMYADPKSEESFYQAMLRLLDENSYDNYQKFISDIRHKKTWEDLADEYLRLLEVRSMK